jgi:hypothetical protein
MLLFSKGRVHASIISAAYVVAFDKTGNVRATLTTEARSRIIFDVEKQ